MLVNGLGLGNSTRCHAVIQQLADLGAEVSVVTQGNGVWYFEGRPEIKAIHEIESLYYAKSDKGLSISRTLGSIGDLVKIQKRNARRVANVLEAYRPDVVVTDSVYTFRPIKKMSIPMAALNNADIVYRSYRRFRERPSSIRAQFYAVEMTDYLFHKFVPDLVISPTFDRSLAVGVKKFVHVNLIVRKGYQSAVREGAAEKAAIMLSGSVFGMPVTLENETFPVSIDVIGREAAPGEPARAGVTYHGKIADTLSILEDADLAVVNGGFSAVSEMFCMRKPMVVIPVPRHAEQWVNARTIERMGVGRLAGEEDFEEIMLTCLESIDTFRQAYRKIPEMENGAVQAARAILRLAETKRS